MSAEPPPPARIVKPRKPKLKNLPIIAITRDSVYLESTGEIFDIDQLPLVVMREKSSILASNTMGRHVLRLHEAFRDSENFQFKLTPVYRDPHADSKSYGRAVLRDTVTTLIGFPGKYHHPIDPHSFVGCDIREIIDRDAPEHLLLLEWAQHVRRFCADNELDVKASAGGLAAQLLKDSRFYPEARRKAPRILNDKVRQKLPGNYYKLPERKGIKPIRKATYIDMENAHHYLATQIEFPCVNTLFAYGFLDTERPKPYAKQGTRRFNELLSRPGMFHVRMMVPRMRKNMFAPPYMEKPGIKSCWIYSNELPLIHKLGGYIEVIHAAIVADETDTGLSKYAEWAIKELADRPEQKPWLKPALHAAYGLLAAKPRPLEIGWRRAKGEDDLFPMDGKMIPVKVVRSKKAQESRVVNAIHRGMIEAEQRRRALELASELQAKGATILCIYADSIFVDMPQLPLLPRPWKTKIDVHNLRFHSATSFESDELVRLPGIPRARRFSATR